MIKEQTKLDYLVRLSAGEEKPAIEDVLWVEFRINAVSVEEALKAVRKIPGFESLEKWWASEVKLWMPPK